MNTPNFNHTVSLQIKDQKEKIICLKNLLYIENAKLECLYNLKSNTKNRKLNHNSKKTNALSVNEWRNMSITQKINNALPEFKNEQKDIADDVTHYLNLTKEQLDKELNEYIQSRKTKHYRNN